MSLFDDGPTHITAGARVNLDRCHVPPQKVIEHARNLGRIGNGTTDVAMYRRLAIQQRAARKDPGTRRGMGRGEACHQGRGHNLIPRAANTRYSGREIKRQDLVARDMGKIQHMHQMHVRSDQPRQRELSSSVDVQGIGRRVRGLVGWSYRDNLFSADHDCAIRKHFAGLGVEHRASFDAKRRFARTRCACQGQPQQGRRAAPQR